MQFLDVKLWPSDLAACALTHRACLLTLDSSLQGHGKADLCPAQSANYNPAVKQFSVCQMNKLHLVDQLSWQESLLSVLQVWGTAIKSLSKLQCSVGTC